MGLGKTLSIISLIATNTPGALLPPVNKPGAQPAAGGAGSSGAPAAGAAAAAGDVGEAAGRPAKRRRKVRAALAAGSCTAHSG
jgi:hypothetical protein